MFLFKDVDQATSGMKQLVNVKAVLLEPTVIEDADSYTPCPAGYTTSQIGSRQRSECAGNQFLSYSFHQQKANKATKNFPVQKRVTCKPQLMSLVKYLFCLG